MKRVPVFDGFRGYAILGVVSLHLRFVELPAKRSILSWRKRRTRATPAPALVQLDAPVGRG